MSLMCSTFRTTQAICILPTTTRAPAKVATVNLLLNFTVGTSFVR